MGSPAAPEPPERAELAAELLDLAPFWHSSLLEPQTAAERYRLPATGPPTARQAMGIDVSKRDAYEVLRGCVVDIHNAIAVEEHMHGVFQHLEEPLSHSKEADFEHRLASL